MIIFEIQGIPIPWQRPGRNNKTGIIYDAQKKQKEQIRWYLMAKYHEMPIKSPVSVNMTFYMPMPKSSSRPRKRDMLNGVLHHMSKPDVDNLVKFYLDVMTGVIYDDDRQIHKITAQKCYATDPYTMIEIYPTHDDMDKHREMDETDAYDY